MHDTDFLFTKVAVSKKVGALLSQTHNHLQAYITGQALTFPEGVLARAGKISRGENYRQLPYLLLDYPRKFTHDDVFALRTMFWWGHFFSVTFQLGGISWQHYRPAVARNLASLPDPSVSLCISDDPWQHHRDADYYRPLGELGVATGQKLIAQRSFLKLAIFLPLDAWQTLPDQSRLFFQQMVRLIELSA